MSLPMLSYEDLDPETKRLRDEHKRRLAERRERLRFTGQFIYDRNKIPDSLLIERGFVASPRRPKVKVEEEEELPEWLKS